MRTFQLASNYFPTRPFLEPVSWLYIRWTWYLWTFLWSRKGTTIQTAIVSFSWFVQTRRLIPFPTAFGPQRVLPISYVVSKILASQFRNSLTASRSSDCILLYSDISIDVAIQLNDVCYSVGCFPSLCWKLSIDAPNSRYSRTYAHSSWWRGRWVGWSLGNRPKYIFLYQSHCFTCKWGPVYHARHSQGFRKLLRSGPFPLSNISSQGLLFPCSQNSSCEFTLLNSSDICRLSMI